MYFVRTQERRGVFWKWLERCTFILLKNHVKLLQKQNNKRNVFVKKSWMEHLLDSECRNGAFKVFKAATCKPRTTDIWVSFFQKSLTFGLGRTFWEKHFWGLWSIFGRTISTHFGNVSTLSIFSIIQPLFLQKTKLLYPIHIYSFGSGIWIWAANNLKFSLRVSVVRVQTMFVFGNFVHHFCYQCFYK